ncbi:MAG: FAD-dependent oxidoreductase [Lentisphaeria bacterium]|nr:MAG: FAD-dependent oxidoreductase [Lentisphaeria bacterium]
MKIVIVGGGVAAFEAALSAGKAGVAEGITLISREKVLPYRRPALSGMVAEPLPDAQFYIKPESFYREKGIDVRLGIAAESIDCAAKTVQLSDGTGVSYDRLLLATGSHCFLPPIPGIDGENVLSLREFCDLETIRTRLEGGVKRVAVIGGGLLGLELAQSLLERGCAVTVIEGGASLLPRNLDAEAAGVALRELGKIPNLVLKFGAVVKEITPAGVRIDGEEIPADLVMVSAGTRANVELAASAGLKCNRGIVVDGRLRTSQPDIFAAGTAPRWMGCFTDSTAARAMGQVAGTNLAGGEETFQAEAFPARLNVFGLKIFSAGVLKGADEKSETDSATGAFRKLFFDAAGKLVGCILIGDLKEALKLQAEIDAASAGPR